MRDCHGRTIDYLRISVTDRCNLRCKYCMPEEIDCVEHRNILSLEEIHTIVSCGANLGIRHVKLTGGEPLVRKDCCRLVNILKEIPGIENVTITTNGVLLKRYFRELLAAGIDGINISLDTVDRKLYQAVTGQDQLEQVLQVIEQAADSSVPVKVNAVSADYGNTPGFKKWDGRNVWQPLVELARNHLVDVRFIELMPVGYGKNFAALDHQRFLEELKQAYPKLERDEYRHGFGPAVYYRIPGFLGSIGLISAMHGKFCGQCNRVRLTSQGYLKSCLCYEDGVDLRRILRQEESRYQKPGQTMQKRTKGQANHLLKDRLTRAMQQAIWEKPEAHCFERLEQMTEKRGMSAIGG